MIKIIKSGTINELYLDTRCELPPTNRKRPNSSFRDQDVAENRKRAAKRAKQQLKRLIWANHSNQTAFVTLTFKYSWATEYELASKEIKKFFQRLAYKQTGQKKSHYKYVCVPETQKCGRWHFHILVFNWPYLDVNVVSDIWGLGGVDIRRVWHDEKHCANYICKYFSKTFNKVGLTGKKHYYRSKNIQGAVIFKSDSGKGYFNNFQMLGYTEIYRYVDGEQNYIYAIFEDPIDDKLTNSKKLLHNMLGKVGIE